MAHVRPITWSICLARGTSSPLVIKSKIPSHLDATDTTTDAAEGQGVALLLDRHKNSERQRGENHSDMSSLVMEL